MSSTAAGGAPGPAAQRHGGGGGGGGCCSSGVTLELVGAFTAVCLVLYGVILYFNYLYVRWSGRDGVHRTSGGGGGGGRGAAARKRGGGGGLDKAALAAIPVFRFKASASAAALGGGEAECAVCLSGMQDGDAVRALPGCGHAFHAGCVDAWLRAHGTCPVCRARPAVPPPPPAKPPCLKAPEPAAAAAGRQPVDLESHV
ncbi:RING-H2 finger protein ATL39 [Oryza sativa Japonica Group]|uniref:RING-type E3 ubiquitin transferase n=2 Tax=Oryza sativa subsp. japonica TaxID=39947 RepID=A0A0P0VH80_ORYSJ|nr:E3 ubiquitin-protein ligase EL5-like [Oryza sativa Japonica Group]KAF2944010.1 hypothetical protein DAI22_02g108050 [Oryza sativa Japonica Group]USH99653.1 putative RING-H2 finger protein [Oryza sativa Japonica Group]BAF08351.1 Os02g0249300 [Oryza sativa Japonica Group]BAS77899.1 Os02g0249300 [Oryza sativa Japonica Group]|eukprot:NP_001046437.1 Os02g0249300 [Oryza sativa Japonica Group]